MQCPQFVPARPTAALAHLPRPNRTCAPRRACASASGASDRPGSSIRCRDNSRCAGFGALRPFAYAFSGQCAAAIAQGDRANATRSIQQDGLIGVGITLRLSELSAVCGDTDRVHALADTLHRGPGLVTSGWLQVDPYFAGLRGNARPRALTGR
jgi:hypothetical protein